MRIAHVTCSLASGGAEKLATDLAIHAQQNGHEVDLITIDKFYDCAYQNKMYARLLNERVSVFSTKRRPGSGYLCFSSLARLVGRICTKKYDVVHSHLQVPHKLVGISRILCPHKFQHMITVHNSKEKWSGFLHHLTHSATVICCSDEVQRSFDADCSKVVIKNGVDLCSTIPHIDEQIAKRKELGIPRDAFVIASVGRLERQKNYLVALNTLSVLVGMKPDMDFRYLVCGTGSEESLIRKHSEHLGVAERVHLLGNRSDVTEILGLADCFLSTSLHEGLPLAVLEALASGISCVLSPIREHQDIVEDLAGCVIGGDLTGHSMAEAVVNSMAQHQPREHLVSHRQAKLMRFSIQECARLYESAYKALVCQ